MPCVLVLVLQCFHLKKKITSAQDNGRPVKAINRANSKHAAQATSRIKYQLRPQGYQITVL